jgi:hypothetical protein
MRKRTKNGKEDERKHLNNPQMDSSVSLPSPEG